VYFGEAALHTVFETLPGVPARHSKATRRP
jgi:hypothetical protein